MTATLSGARLLTHRRNSAGERVRIALRLKGIELPCLDALSLPPARWASLNPQGLMPALMLADGSVVAQATAILELLEEVIPKPALLPADPVTRARARAFAAHLASDLHSITVQRVRRHLRDALSAPEQKVNAWVAHWTQRALSASEADLARRDTACTYCFGETPGWAELHLVPQLRASRRLGCDLAPYPLLCAVEAACDSHPAFDLPTPAFAT